MLFEGFKILQCDSFFTKIKDEAREQRQSHDFNRNKRRVVDLTGGKFIFNAKKDDWPLQQYKYPQRLTLLEKAPDLHGQLKLENTNWERTCHSSHHNHLLQKKILFPLAGNCKNLHFLDLVPKKNVPLLQQPLSSFSANTGHSTVENKNISHF